MPILKGISHIVLSFNTEAGTKKSGVKAKAKVCFGNDNDAIGEITYVSKDGGKTYNWELPMRSSTGTEISFNFPICLGAVGQELVHIIGQNVERFKKEALTNYAGKSFRVTEKKVEEIK